MNNVKINQLIGKANSIIDLGNEFLSSTPIQNITDKLANAKKFIGQNDANKPLIITLIGGTGVGKSFIFSSLLDIKNASPSSDSIRSFTKDLFISANDNNRPFLPNINFDQVHFCNGILSDVVLIDTPDIDTINTKNASLTKSVIDISDILVYITIPDKRSNFDISQTIINWASRKRWFFVMNKADTVTSSELEGLKKDFDYRIKELGFTVNDNCRFILQANQPSSFDYRKFKDMLVSQMAVEQTKQIRFEAKIKALLYSFENESVIDQIMHMNADIASEIQRQQNIRDLAEAEILSKPEIVSIFQAKSKNVLWKQLLNKNCLFLLPGVLIKVKLANTNTDTLLKNIISNEFSHHPEVLKLIDDSRRFLEDNNIDSDNYNDVAYSKQIQNFNIVDLQVNQSAVENIDSKWISFYIFLANLPPTLIFIKALYIALNSWGKGVWLPTDFFIHALILMLGATILGHYLLSLCISRLATSHINSLSNIENIPRKLHKVNKSISRFLDLSSNFQSNAKSLLIDNIKDGNSITFGSSNHKNNFQQK